MYTLNLDLVRQTHDSLHSEDDMQSVVSTTTGRRVHIPKLTDKQMNELIYLVFGDSPEEEDSYDY
jgi:hypothetical protein